MQGVKAKTKQQKTKKIENWKTIKEWTDWVMVFYEWTSTAHAWLKHLKEGTELESQI